MFHRALWMRAYKQGKVAIWLLWGVSLFSLSISYASDASNMAQWREYGDWVYSFHFNYVNHLLPLSGLSFLLACLLTGGERTNQGMDFIFAMPFKRRDIFLSKWFIGAATITGITLINMLFMFIIQKTTIHGEYQTFAPFLHFFLFLFVALLAIYSLTLFIGAVTGGFVSQALLTIIIGILPIGLYQLISAAIGWHIIWMNGYRDLSAWIWTIFDFFIDISIFPVIIANPAFMYQQLEVGGTVFFHQFALPSLTTYIALLIYLVVSFLLGLFLYKRTPSENNGKIILYKKLDPIFLWCTVVCFALLGGEIGAGFFWNTITFYYIGFIISGIICYIILSRLMKKPLKLKMVRKLIARKNFKMLTLPKK